MNINLLHILPISPRGLLGGKVGSLIQLNSLIQQKMVANAIFLLVCSSRFGNVYSIEVFATAPTCRLAIECKAGYFIEAYSMLIEDVSPFFILKEVLMVVGSQWHGLGDTHGFKVNGLTCKPGLATAHTPTDPPFWFADKNIDLMHEKPHFYCVLYVGPCQQSGCL